MDSNWQEQKAKYLKMLTEINETMRKILDIDEKRYIIDPEMENRLKSLQESNTIFMEKLDKEIFEVATIGLEKSGKSTLANALIASDMLPTNPQRCTYTTAQIEYGENDEACVEFYEIEEFNKEIFQSMLKELKYNSSEDFKTFRLEPFCNYFEQELQQTNKELYQLHKETTFEDIKEIIAGRSTILRYLNNPPRKFSGADKIKSGEFKEFITDKFKSRAVKKIVIKSSELKNTRNIIIYDVPGFDSPTAIHQKQTMERIKNAEAIILVSDSGARPNLNAPQLNILLKERDSDNIPLEEKLFVFGNRIDRANSTEDAQQKIQFFKEDAIERYKIVKGERFFIGSAQAHLEGLGLVQDQGIREIMKTFGLNYGIDDLKAGLVNYYQNDRFRILKRKIDLNIEKFFEALNFIIEQNKGGEETFEKEKNNLVLEFNRSSKEKIKEEFSQLREDIKKDIFANKYFTEDFKVLINEINQPLTGNIINEYRKQANFTPGLEVPVGRVNFALRKELYYEVTGKFSKIILKLADEKAKENCRKVLETFINVLGISFSNPYYEEVLHASEEFINSVTYEVSYNKKNFIFLIERFAGDLFDILINYPLGSTDRYEKFKNAEQDFYNLAMYHDNNDLNKMPFEQPLISIILAHKEITSKAPSKDAVKSILDAVKAYPSLLGLFKDEEELKFEIKKSIEGLSEDSIDIDKLKTELKDLSKKSEGMISKVYLIFTLKTAVRNDTEISQASEKSPVAADRDTFIKGLLKEVRPASTMDEVLSEINRDLQYLAELLKSATLNAISLEKPFVSTITKQINLITRKVAEHECKEYEDFIARYVQKICPDKFEHVHQKKNYYTQREMVVRTAEDAVRKLRAI